MADEAVQNRKQRVTDFLKDNHNLMLVCLLAVVSIIYLYYFFKLGEQPIWWDEGDYLAIARVWAAGMSTPEWWAHFTGMRPLLLPIIWAFMFKLGFSEFVLRFFTELLPSLGSVLMCYLLGKELYNKKTGLIAAVMMAFYWNSMFYTFRLMTDIPAVFFGLLAFYFFWTDYIKKNKARGIYLAALFGVISFSIRFPYSLVLISCAVFLLIIKKHHIIKDKTAWKGLLAVLIFLSPYLAYFIYNKFAAISFYFGSSAVTVHQPTAWFIFGLYFGLPDLFWQIAISIGLLSLYTIFLYGDAIWKQRTKEFNADLFVFVWLAVHFIFYVFIIKGGTDRWIMMLFPASFILAGKAIVSIGDILKKYQKYIPLVLILVIIGGGVYQNFTHANSLINDKKTSYGEVKEAGLWLKENTPADAKIITASIVQNQYYSQRQSYDYSYNSSVLSDKGCVDEFGATNTSDYCQNLSESLFEIKKDMLKPDYMIVSVFEPVFTPNWVYTYGQRHNMTVVQAYTLNNDGKQAVLLIYKF